MGGLLREGRYDRPGLWKRRSQSWSRPARLSTYWPRVWQGKQHRSRTGSRSAPSAILSLGSGAPPRAPPLRRSVVRIPSAPPGILGASNFAFGREAGVQCCRRNGRSTARSGSSRLCGDRASSKKSRRLTLAGRSSSSATRAAGR